MAREITTVSLKRATAERLREYKYETRNRNFNAAVEDLLDEAGVEVSLGD